MTLTPARQAADVLRVTADAYRTGRLTLAVGHYVHPDDPRCRCALGGIAWIANPDAEWPDVFSAGPIARTAMVMLGEYLVNELGAPACADDDGDPDWVETVGGWNDEPGRTPGEVADAMVAASEYRPVGVQ